MPETTPLLPIHPQSLPRRKGCQGEDGRLKNVYWDMVVESANLPKRGIKVHVANFTTRRGACVSRCREKVTGGPCTVLARSDAMTAAKRGGAGCIALSQLFRFTTGKILTLCWLLGIGLALHCWKHRYYEQTISQVGLYLPGFIQALRLKLLGLVRI